MSLNLKEDSRYHAFHVLKEYFNSTAYAQDMINKSFHSQKIPIERRNYINNLVLGIIRNKGKFDYILTDLYDGDYTKLKSGIKYILYIGLFQLDYLKSTPDHAAVSISVDLTKNKYRGLDKLVNAILRNYIKRRDEYFLDNNKKETYSLLSHPIWIVNRWIKKYGYKKTLDICDFNNSEQTVWFRANNLKYKKEILMYAKSDNENINFHPLHELFFNVSNSQRLIKSNLFIKGKISVQNPTNGFIVDLLNPKNNDVILDGCGAPGGKGTFISHKAPKAKIFSIDNNKKRINLFINSAKRQNNKNIVFKYNDISKDNLPECNKILIDVPCTGTGVINRRVDIRWRRKLSDMKKITILQSRILENASKYLKSNGILVYSTCSIENDENENIIEDFLNRHDYVVEDAANYVKKDIVREKSIKILPGEYGMDGGYAIRLRKL
tara:strand:+ start:66407 stop:67720 length:1314 start_codon:yes stop_codon:yes gene_type:complete